MLATLPRLNETSPLSGLNAGFMDVTPDMAATWLSLVNTGNRVLDKKLVDNYARDMARGNWEPDGMPLRFAGDFGRLLDGQHRLTAQVRVGATVEYLVVTWVPDGAQEVMDGGKKRSLKDMLDTTRHVSNASQLAAVTRVVHAYGCVGSGTAQNTQHQATLKELLHRFDANPGIQTHGVISQRDTPPGLTKSLLGGFLYLASLADEEDAAAFREAITTGAGLEVGNPIHTLRERLAKGAASSSDHIHTVVRWVFLVRAWNAWRAGETLSRLQFKPGGAHPDRIPQIDGILPADVPGNQKEAMA